MREPLQAPSCSSDLLTSLFFLNAIDIFGFAPFAAAVPAAGFLSAGLSPPAVFAAGFATAFGVGGPKEVSSSAVRYV